MLYKIDLTILTYAQKQAVYVHLEKHCMNAVIWTIYGPPNLLRLAKVEKPPPKDDGILIQVHATTVIGELSFSL